MRRASINVLWIAGLLLAAGPARAQPQQQSPVVTAKRWVDEAILLADQGDYDGAIKKVNEARHLLDGPALKVYSAQLHVKAHRLLEARRLYQEVVALEDIDKLKPPAKVADAARWHRAQKEAQADARKELTDLIPRIPSLTVTVSGADTVGLKVTVDGEPIESRQAVPLEVGGHTITAEAPGTIKATKKVELKEGAKETVTLMLVPVPQLPTTRSVPAAAIVAWTVGGAGLVVGAIAGGIILGERAKSAEFCHFPATDHSNNGCPDSYLDPLYPVSHLSTVGFTLFGAGALAGTLVFFLSPKKISSPQVGIVLGPGFAGMKGSF